jgi:hypothetical protein
MSKRHPWKGKWLAAFAVLCVAGCVGNRTDSDCAPIKLIGVTEDGTRKEIQSWDKWVDWERCLTVDAKTRCTAWTATIWPNDQDRPLTAILGAWSCPAGVKPPMRDGAFDHVFNIIDYGPVRDMDGAMLVNYQELKDLRDDKRSFR